MSSNHSVSYVIQQQAECLELRVAWTGTGYTAALLRYDTSEPLPGVIAPSSKARQVVVAERPAQRFRSTTLQAFALAQRDSFITGKFTAYLQDLQDTPIGDRP